MQTRVVQCKIETSARELEHGVYMKAGTISFNGLEDISVEELGETIRQLNRIYQDLLMERQQLEYELTWNI